MVEQILVIVMSTSRMQTALQWLPSAVPALLHTEDFESGQAHLAQTDSTRLELLLKDLNRRKDYDYAQHNDQPGPDSAYLWSWVRQVTSELESRGYYVDAAGQLHRPGTVVEVR